MLLRNFKSGMRLAGETLHFAGNPILEGSIRLWRPTLLHSLA